MEDINNKFFNIYIKKITVLFYLFRSFLLATEFSLVWQFWGKPCRKDCGRQVSFLEVAHHFAMTVIHVLWGRMDPRDFGPRLFLDVDISFHTCHSCIPHGLLSLCIGFSHSTKQISLIINMKIHIHVVMLFRHIDYFILPDNDFIELLN